MKATDVAAWWGAIVATLILLWDVYKWKRTGRPIINVTASPNMKTLGDEANLHGKKLIVVEVTNTGDRKTTLTHLVGVQYRSVFRRFLRKQEYAFFVPNNTLSERLPYVLEPGQRWLGGILQNEELEQGGRDGYLYCGVNHSSRKKPVLQRVVIL
jgi:hypothetical protein